jgi:hypothetical protein
MEILSLNFIHLLNLTRSSYEKCNYLRPLVEISVYETVQQLVLSSEMHKILIYKVPISLVGSLRIWKEHKKLVNKFFNLF